jgi:transaldolase
MASTLDQLKSMTVVVADTGDLQQVGTFRPRDATTNPSLIAAAAGMPEYAPLVESALRWSRAQGPKDIAARAVDRLAVEFGLKILNIVEGRVSTEVDARLSFDTAATVDRARSLIAQYERAGASRERVLIKIAGTWEGICAAKILEQERIHCNVTLLFGLHQAIASAEANVTLVSPFVGRILDWYRKDAARDFVPSEDPGVLSVASVYNYYKRHGYATEVMGASFRNTGEILELAGCDLLTISPAFLSQLDSSTTPVVRKLDPLRSRGMDIPKIPMNEETFQRMHAEDRMATDKLADGIESFNKALIGLETQLDARIASLS